MPSNLQTRQLTREQRIRLRYLIDQAKRERLNTQPPAGRNQETRRASYAAYYARNRSRILARRAERKAA